MDALDVAIVGSGFSGLGLAIRLRRQGVEDFVVLERGDGVGGTWHYNTYPGLRLRRAVAPVLVLVRAQPGLVARPTRTQPEIRAYLRARRRPTSACAARSGSDTEVARPRWDDDAQRWEHRDRPTGRVRAQVLVSGTGPLAEPKIPDLPGLERFEGRCSTPPAGTTRSTSRASASPSIGTGASAIQFVPAIAARRRAAARLPAHAAVGHAAHRAGRSRASSGGSTARVPARSSGSCAAASTRRASCSCSASSSSPRLMRLLERLARRHMRAPDVATPRCCDEGHARLHDRLQAHPAVQPLVPGARRATTSSWSPTASRRSASARSSAADGVEREVDAIVFGTGFHVTDMPVGRLVRGRGGRTLDGRLGRQPARAPRRHGRRLPEPVHPARPEHRARAQLDGLHDRVADRLRDRRAARDATRAGADDRRGRGRRRRERYNARRRRQHARARCGTRGCASWYLDDTGRNATLWPDWTWRFRRRHGRASTRRLRRLAPCATERRWRREPRVIITGAASGIGAATAELRARGRDGRRARPARRRTT